jgi:hypothetical protein
MEIATIEVAGVYARRVTRSNGRWEIPAGLIGGTIRLKYGQDWQDLQKTVVFDCCGLTKDVVDAGEIVTVPAEVVERPERKLLVGLYGVGQDGTATPTIWLEGYVCAAADPSGDPSTDPSLPVWAELENWAQVLEEKTLTLEAQTQSLENQTQAMAERILKLEGRKPQCAVIWELFHVSTADPVYQVPMGETFSAALVAENGFRIYNVTVWMGGRDVTQSVYRDGRIWVPQVIGNLVIQANAEPLSKFVPYHAPTMAGGAIDLSGALVSADANWLHTDYIPVVPGQMFRYVGDTSAWSEYASVWGYDETGSPSAMLVGNGNHLFGAYFVVPEGIYGLRCSFSESSWHTLDVAEEQTQMAGEAAFIPGIVITITGEQSPREGGGATDFLPIGTEGMVAVYNIIPHNGGRICYYNAEKTFLDTLTIHKSMSLDKIMTATRVIPANTAFVRISTNVLDSVRATVRTDA